MDFESQNKAWRNYGIFLIIRLLPITLNNRKDETTLGLLNCQCVMKVILLSVFPKTLVLPIVWKSHGMDVN